MEPMRRFFPAAWIGFTIALVSGVLLLLAYPTKALTDPVFYLKLALIAAALYCLQWMRRRVFVDADPLVTLVPDGRLRYNSAFHLKAAFLTVAAANAAYFYAGPF